MSDSSPSLLWEGWQETQQETVFSADSPDLVVASEPVGQPVEEVQLSQSSWVLWLCWFCSTTSWFHCLLLLMILR